MFVTSTFLKKSKKIPEIEAETKQKFLDGQSLEDYRKVKFLLFSSQNNQSFLKASFKIEKFNLSMDNLCLEKNANSWMFLTANNPYSQDLSEEINAQKHKNLTKFLSQERYEFEEFFYPFTGEKSVIIFDLNK
jgi:hypothetical protein